MGQLYSGAVWLASALAWSVLGTTAGVLVIMGAHYLQFSHLYGMRVFLPLGAGMWFAGLAIALWAREASVIGAWLTGLALVGVGVWADGPHRNKFAADG